MLWTLQVLIIIVNNVSSINNDHPNTVSPQSTTSIMFTSESAVMQGATASGNVGGIVAGIIIGVAILAGLIVMVVIVIVVLQRRSKRFSTSNGTTRTSEYPLSNAVYGSKLKSMCIHH